MVEFRLVIGNKNYSSWSLRPWLVLKRLGLNFEEILIPLYRPESKEKILDYSPSGRVPLLIHSDVTIWESLAICEYLAELYPQAHLWPEEQHARATARAISLEMHAGFANLRQNLPMDTRASRPNRTIKPEVQSEIDRISEIWRESRQRWGSGGDFLFGHFTIADAMFAPVVSRFATYGVRLDAVGTQYMQTIWAMPELEEWLAAASREPWIINF